MSDGHGAIGLGENVGGTGVHRFEGVSGAFLGEGADDHDGRHGGIFLEEAQEGESVHARHLEIEGEDVGQEFGHFLLRDEGIVGGSDDLDFWVQRERVGDGFPDEGGIVDDEHFDFVWGGHGKWVSAVS
jgi:hypothetical protein